MNGIEDTPDRARIVQFSDPYYDLFTADHRAEVHQGASRRCADLKRQARRPRCSGTAAEDILRGASRASSRWSARRSSTATAHARGDGGRGAARQADRRGLAAPPIPSSRTSASPSTRAAYVRSSSAPEDSRLSVTPSTRPSTDEAQRRAAKAIYQKYGLLDAPPGDASASCEHEAPVARRSGRAVPDALPEHEVVSPVTGNAIDRCGSTGRDIARRTRGLRRTDAAPDRGDVLPRSSADCTTGLGGTSGRAGRDHASWRPGSSIPAAGTSSPARSSSSATSGSCRVPRAGHASGAALLRRPVRSHHAASPTVLTDGWQRWCLRTPRSP